MKKQFIINKKKPLIGDRKKLRKEDKWNLLKSEKKLFTIFMSKFFGYKLLVKQIRMSGNGIVISLNIPLKIHVIQKILASM